MSNGTEPFERAARIQRANAIRLLNGIFRIPKGYSGGGETDNIVDCIVECAVARVLEIMIRQQEEKEKEVAR